MQHYHQLDKEGLLLINFKKVFAVIQTLVINQCTDFDLIKNNKLSLKSTDVQRLLLHHTIHELCEEVINHKSKNKKVIIFRPFSSADTFEILEYVTIPEINKLMHVMIGRIQKILPIQITIIGDTASFQDLKEKLDKKDGETIELIHKILCSMKPVNLSFLKAKAFAHKHKLKFLSRDYFDLLKTKQMFF